MPLVLICFLVVAKIRYDDFYLLKKLQRGVKLTKNSASDALLELAENDKNRSEAKRFFELLDDIELAVKSGVSREKIIKTLNEQNFTMTLNLSLIHI